MYDLGFLNVRFELLKPTVAESAGDIVINASWCSPSCFFSGLPPTQTIRYTTGDINSTSVLDKALLSRTFPVESGTALGRSACTAEMRATTECWWNSNIYDYVGVSDYAPSAGVWNFNSGTPRQGMTIVISNDRIYEVPDETIHIRMFIHSWTVSLQLMHARS